MMLIIILPCYGCFSTMVVNAVMEACTIVLGAFGKNPYKEVGSSLARVR